MTLRIQLFGPLQAVWQGKPLPPMRRLRLQSLFAYLLLLHRHRPAPRGHLAFTFWPDVSEARARTNLRQHLYLLRQWLPPPGDEPWFLSDPDEVRLNPRADLWVDVWAFEDSLPQGEAKLEAAVELVTADLLPHLYDGWLLLERERLRRSYARALAWLATLYQARGDWPVAVAWARRLVAHDPLNEEAHRLLITLYYASGNRAAALQQFEHCQHLLREQLDVAPMAETLALRDAIVRGEPLPATWSTAPAQSPAVATSPAEIEHPAGPAQEKLLPADIPFVGREAEWQRLADHWRQATRRSGSLLLIGGEAGVGKTRLLHELAKHAQRQGGQVLWGHCHAFERSIPYQPVVEMLQAALPRLASSHIAPLWLAEAARLLPELRARRPDLPDPLRLEPEHEQGWLIEGLYRCLLGLATQQPLLVLLEDLHHATDSTLTWLHALSRQVRGAPILIVGTYRLEEVGRGHPLRDLIRELQREGWGMPLILNPLAPAATQALVERLSGLGQAAADLARRLHAESEGNPFFLSELIWHLHETGQLYLREGRSAGPWVEAGGEGPLPLPDSVREAIQARLERLGETAQDLLGCAAVAGREFDLVVIRAAVGWREERVLRALDELLRRGLVREGTGVGARDHVFSHHLVQEVVYEALPRARRQTWHRRVAEAMARAYGEAVAGELAYHFDQAGDHEQALKYLKLAGDQAASRYANAEALDYYGRALALLSGDTRPTLVTRFDLLAARAAVWGLLGRREEQRADLEALEAAARALDDDLRLAQAYVLWAAFYEETSDHAASARAARSALALFQQVGDRRGEAQSWHDLGLAAYRQGDYRAARDYYQAALALRQEIGDHAGEAASLNHLGNLMRQVGEFATARAYHEQALALHRANGDRVGEAESLRSLGVLNAMTGNYMEAQACYEQGLALSRRIGHRRDEAALLQDLAFLSTVTGDFHAAEAYQRRASALYQATGDQEGMAWVFFSQAALAWRLGQDAVARDLWQRALDLARTLGTRRQEIWTLDQLGYAMCQVGEYETGRTYLEQALDLARQAGDRWLEAHSLHHLGQLAWTQGDITTAVGHWREAAALREAIGLTASARASRARLAEALTVLGRLSEAGEMAEATWAAWRAGPPLGEEEDEVRQGYLALARAFTHLNQPEAAQACLEQAQTFIQERAGHIADATLRQAFLANVTVNREIQWAVSSAWK